MKVYVLTTDKRKHLESITKPEWIKISKDITYWNNTGHHPGHGRNRILEDFYLNHTDQWCVIADDDNIIDPARGYYNRFIDQLDYVLETASANDIATFGFLNNIVHRVDITIKHPTLQHNWVWMRSFSLSNIFFHRRTKLVRFNETQMIEDQEWCMDQLKNGMRCATLMNAVIKDVNHKSTLFRDNTDRKQQYQIAKDRWMDKFPELKTDRNGRVRKTHFVKKYWRPNILWSGLKNIGVACYNPYKI